MTTTPTTPAHVVGTWCAAILASAVAFLAVGIDPADPTAPPVDRTSAVYIGTDYTGTDAAPIPPAVDPIGATPPVIDPTAPIDPGTIDAAAGPVARGINPARGCDPVDPDPALMALGWVGDPNDHAEAIYPPGCVAPVGTAAGCVPTTDPARMADAIAAGWVGDPTDGMEAVYAPGCFD